MNNIYFTKLNFPFMLTGLLTLVTASTYSNPIRAQGADPHMIYYGGYYYLLNSQIGERSIISSPTLDWEKHGAPINEGPHALYNNLSQVYITYSASSCGTAFYSLGLLTWTGGDPTQEASWTKSPESVLSSANGNYGTGHNGVFLSPDQSKVWNVFHAEDQYPCGACNSSRYSMAERVYFGTDGTPTFEMAMKLGTVEAGPAGEDGGSIVADPEPSQN